MIVLEPSVTAKCGLRKSSETNNSSSLTVRLVITRRTVRGNKLFVSELFLRAHFVVTDGSKTIILRATHLLTQRDIRPDVQWFNLRLVCNKL